MVLSMTKGGSDDDHFCINTRFYYYFGKKFKPFAHVCGVNIFFGRILLPKKRVRESKKKAFENYIILAFNRFLKI